MHEMSIAVNILEIAGQEARQAGAKTVSAIEIEVGQLAGVEVSSLEFCFETARTSDPLTAAAELVIHTINGRGRCPQCNFEFDMDFFVAICPECGQCGADVLQGRELKVRSLRVD